MQLFTWKQHLVPINHFNVSPSNYPKPRITQIPEYYRNTNIGVFNRYLSQVYLYFSRVFRYFGDSCAPNHFFYIYKMYSLTLLHLYYWFTFNLRQLKLIRRGLRGCIGQSFVRLLSLYQPSWRQLTPFYCFYSSMMKSLRDWKISLWLFLDI